MSEQQLAARLKPQFASIESKPLHRSARVKVHSSSPSAGGGCFFPRRCRRRRVPSALACLLTPASGAPRLAVKEHRGALWVISGARVSDCSSINQPPLKPTALLMRVGQLIGRRSRASPSDGRTFVLHASVGQTEEETPLRSERDASKRSVRNDGSRSSGGGLDGAILRWR